MCTHAQTENEMKAIFFYALSKYYDADKSPESEAAIRNEIVTSQSEVSTNQQTNID